MPQDQWKQCIFSSRWTATWNQQGARSNPEDEPTPREWWSRALEGSEDSEWLLEAHPATVPSASCHPRTAAWERSKRMSCLSQSSLASFPPLWLMQKTPCVQSDQAVLRMANSIKCSLPESAYNFKSHSLCLDDENCYGTLQSKYVFPIVNSSFSANKPDLCWFQCSPLHALFQWKKCPKPTYLYTQNILSWVNSHILSTQYYDFW